MSTKIPTKKELIAAMSATKFRQMSENGGAYFVNELDAKGNKVYEKGYRPKGVWVDKPRIPLEDFIADLDGFVACIYTNGLVTLDVPGAGQGELFRTTVSGATMQEIIKNGAAELRKCILKSGLN